ncbi:MAG TPA: 4a-hydroxytetrahydrobiopterin dehydratase [Mycobacteriales bacterium]|nr:4a-hydroxytetrahydrobiopterin dehydratase [Mycobacteriales bacterium]
MTLMSEGRIGEWQQAHPGWERDGGTLTRSVECSSFPAAIELVRRVADVAEERDHHPDIDIRWRTLRFALSTHSEGGITEKDTALAETIDQLVTESE